MVWLLDLAYVSMNICPVDWRTGSGETADTTAAVEGLSVDVREMYDLLLLLEEVAG